jgi:putative transposon-encoded protein
MAKLVELKDGKLKIEDKISLVYEKVITKFGTGAKIDAPKEFIGKKVYVMIQEE